MCLLTYKPIGVPFDTFLKKSIENGYENNKDGIGFALKRNDEIIVKKGVVKPKVAIGWLEALDIQESEELLIHLRYGTSGVVMDSNCHPFIITKNIADSVCEDVITKHPVMGHNGVFGREHYDETHEEYCDTWHITNQYLADPALVYLMKSNPELFKKLFKTVNGFNRVLIMFPSRYKTIQLGSWTEDKGVFFSNGQYKCSRKNKYKDDEDYTYSNLQKKWTKKDEIDWEEDWKSQYPELAKSPFLNKPTSSRALIGSGNTSLKKLEYHNLKAGLIVESTFNHFLKPVGTEDTQTIIREFDMIRLIYGFEVNGEPHWKATFAFNSKIDFTIPEDFLLQYYKEKLDTNNNSLTTKSLKTLSKDYQIAKDENELVYKVTEWTKSRYKNIMKGYNKALAGKKAQLFIKLNGKDYGPFKTSAIASLIQSYENIKNNKQSTIISPIFQHTASFTT